jgi:hypothetical protein
MVGRAVCLCYGGRRLSLPMLREYGLSRDAGHRGRDQRDGDFLPVRASLVRPALAKSTPSK